VENSTRDNRGVAVEMREWKTENVALECVAYPIAFFHVTKCP